MPKSNLESTEATPDVIRAPRLSKLERLQQELAAAEAKAAAKIQAAKDKEVADARTFAESIAKRVAPELLKSTWTSVLVSLNDKLLDIEAAHEQAKQG